MSSTVARKYFDLSSSLLKVDRRSRVYARWSESTVDHPLKVASEKDEARAYTRHWTLRVDLTRLRRLPRVAARVASDQRHIFQLWSSECYDRSTILGFVIFSLEITKYAGLTHDDDILSPFSALALRPSPYLPC